MSMIADFDQRIKRLIQSTTARQSLTVIVGTGLSSFLGAIFFLLLAPLLGPERFGIYAFLTALLVILSDVFDIGTNGGIVRFVSSALSRQDKIEAQQALKLGLKIKLLVAILLFFVGVALSTFISGSFLKSGEYRLLVLLSFAATLPSLLYDFTAVALQSQQRFKEYILQGLVSNLTRLALVYPLVMLFGYLYGAFLALILGLITSIFFGFQRLGLTFLAVQNEDKLISKVYHFNRYLAVAFMAAAISARADVVLLTKLSSLKEVGIFSLAQRLTFVFPQIVAGLTTVFGPKFAHFQSYQEAKSFLNKTLAATGMLSLATALLALLSPWLIPLLFGPRFATSASVFQTLLAAMIFLLLQVGPIAYLTYYLARPIFQAIFSLGQLVIVLMMNFLLIPSYGAIGAAITAVLSQAFIVVAALATISLTSKNKSTV